LKIAVDAMGGDRAPDVIIEAVEGSELRDSVVLVGDESKLQGKVPAGLEIVHAPEIIGMGEHPTEAFRKKKKSSIGIGTELQKQSKVDAFVGAGNTGAYMAFATLGLGRLKSVERPALATFFPAKKGYTLVLDVGANTSVKPSHLLQFGAMGSLYVEKITGKENPLVALLSMGEEETKGDTLTRKAFELMRESSLNFVGNIEGHHILDGNVDVVVCEGTIGNAILKFGESVVEVIQEGVRNIVNTSLKAKLGGALLKPSLKAFFARMSYDEYGGAVLLGTNGITIISHGRSSPKAIRNAIRMAAKCVEENINSSIENRIKEFNQ
jgi:glycerol-3-phosphate acyltransferase PlsX